MAAQKLAGISGADRTAALVIIRARLEAQKKVVLAANQIDKDNAKVNGVSAQLQKVRAL